MTEVKRNFDDDDGDLKDIDVDGKIGMSSSDEEEEVEEEANEVMDLPEGGLDALPDLWLVKLPKSLMERWSKIEDPNVTLAKIRVYPAVEGAMEHNITLHLPENPQYDTTGESTNFRLSVPIKEIDNTYVFSDKAKLLPSGQPAPKNARSTRLIGRVRHKGSVIPVLDDRYMAKVRKRYQQANLKTRMTARIDDKLASGGRLTGGNALNDPESLKLGKMNYKMLASGSSRTGGGINMSKQPGAVKKDIEKYARMPQNELLDKLVELFSIRDVWSFKDIRTQVEQPQAYLKEVLPMIAVSPRNGPNANMWMLNDIQKAMLARSIEGGAGPSSPALKAEITAKMEAGGENLSGDLSDLSVHDDEDDDQDEDMSDDMEEV